VAVGDGTEALARLREQSFDMVLLDLMMPGMNGIDVLRTIKADSELQETAVVMLSAFDEVADIGRCFEMGAEDYLLKPFDRIVLNVRLHAILERKRLQNSERKRTLQLEQAERDLLRSNEELRRFASVVSHDLQEPLRMVTSYIQLLQRSMGTNITIDQKEYIQFAVDGARRMSNLIQDLLSYSHVSAGTPRREKVDCNKIIDEVAIHLRTAIEESGAKISPYSLPVITADKAQMRQLFQNLISNAIKYRSQRSLTIRIGASEENGEWLFSVADNGLGIAEEDQQKIFQMFLRLHDGNIPGTGIGLAICQRVVEGLGGKIWVESELGKGSTFFFTIPVQ
jgi:light-regulated signal transduction histidine kinase (bacteriophytochrome)